MKPEDEKRLAEDAWSCITLIVIMTAVLFILGVSVAPMIINVIRNLLNL